MATSGSPPYNPKASHPLRGASTAQFTQASQVIAGSGGEPLLLLLAVPLLVASLRYHLSRCPRCGYGFFTRTTSRVAALHHQAACGHCRLSLDAR